MNKPKWSENECSDLIAYLSDETDGPTTDRVANWLEKDPAAQAEKRSLEESWRLLEILDRPAVGAEFTTRTMSLAGEIPEPPDVTTDFLAPLATSKMAPPAPIPQASNYTKPWWLLAAVVGGAAGWFGASAVPNPHRNLLLDLPILERLDEWKAARSVQFLRDASAAKLLDTSPRSNPGAKPK